MIAWLCGVPRFIEGLSVVLDVNGVGYRLHCPLRTLEGIRFPGSLTTERCEFFVEPITREDGTTLYGFATVAERDWFRVLTTVQSVGGKLALSALGVLGVEGLVAAVRAEDLASLCTVPGIGRRVADRILTELRVKPLLPGEETISGSTKPAFVSGEATAATEALKQIGYSNAEVQKGVAEAVRNGAATAEDIIQWVIKTGLKAA